MRTNHLFRLLKQAIQAYPWRSAMVVALILISASANVYGSLFIKELIDHYIVKLMQASHPDFTNLFHALGWLACLYGVGILASYFYNRLCITISIGTLRDLREKLFNHMQTLPLAYFDTHSHGDILSVYTNDIDTLRQVLSMSIPVAINSLVTIISVTLAMFGLNVFLAIVTLLMGVVMILTSRAITSKASVYFRQQQSRLGESSGFIEEMLEGAKVIKVFTHEKQSIEDFSKINQRLFEASSQANTYANILMPALGNLGYISLIVIALVGSLLAVNHLAGLTLGTIGSFIQLNRSFNGPIGQISQQLNAIIMADAGASRVFALLDQESETNQGEVTLDKVDHTWVWAHPSGKTYPLKGDVQFHHVDFSYARGKQILKNISLYAKPGQKIAFVGATGAGKTTITNLINRFYEIEKGQITYDGIDIQLINKNDLRRSLGMVLQDVNLFTGSILDNIRYGRLDATDEECIAAAKLANADQFIGHLEHGYDTQITNDAQLSQGQKQLLSIARAAVANPPVLILDEATSSIDTHTEAIVQEGMDKLMAGRTVFVIAHRLSTIVNADAIMVLDHGQIIEKGNHESLLKEKGVYYQLYTGAIELD